MTDKCSLSHCMVCRDRHSLSSVLGQSEEKENLPATGHIAQEPVPLAQTPPSTQRPAITTQELTPLSQTPPLSQRPTVSTQEGANHSQMAALTESNAHTTITSYTPPTTPCPTHTINNRAINHTTKEDAIEILDSEDEAVNERISGAIPIKGMPMMSHDNHMSECGYSLSPADKYIPGEKLHHLASSSGTHGAREPQACSTDVKSLLGKRKSYERYPEDDLTYKSHDSDKGVSMKSIGSSDHQGRPSMTHSCVSMVTDSRDCENKGTNTDGREKCGTRSGMSMGGTGMESETAGTEILEISELDSQKIRDRSLAEIDEMLATVPLEELTDFPIVAPDNNASTAAKDMTTPTRNMTTPIRTDMCDSSMGIPKGSELIQLSEVKGHGVEQERSVSPVFDQESEDLRRAMAESLRTQVRAIKRDNTSVNDFLYSF